MPTTGLWHMILWLHYLALGIWTGSIIFFATVVASNIHHSIVSKAVAGETVGQILKRLNVLEISCAGVLVFTTLSSFHFVNGGREQGLFYLAADIVLMGIMTLFYSCHLTPRMDQIKAKIPTLDVLPDSHAAKGEFNRLHKLYVKLMSLNLALGLLALYLSVVLLG